MKNLICAVGGLFLVVFTVILISCNKYDDLGTTILPEADNLNLVVFDTATIYTSTIKEDTLRSNGFTGFPVSLNIIGSLNESMFGNTKASAYMQLNVSRLNNKFDSLATPDSLVLCLALNSYYGDTTAPIRYRVYKMDSKINTDSAYYTSTILPAGTLIGDAIITTKPGDSIAEFGVKKVPHIRIPLDMTLAADLINNNRTNNGYADNATFVNYFNGIYITAESQSNPGCMYVFDYKNAQSKMALYYKISADSDSLSFNYVFDELARFNHYDHDYYAGSEVYQALDDSTTGENYTYLQSMAGVRTKVVLPFLKTYFESNPSMVINNAVLVFKAEKNTLFPPHKLTALTYVDATGKPQTFSPDNNEFANAGDGAYIESSGEYRFNITRYVNDVMAGARIDYGIYLRGSSSIINPYQTRLYGFKNPQGKIKLEITYTKF